MPETREEHDTRVAVRTAPAIGWGSLASPEALLEVGDVVHVRNKGFVSRAIRWFSRAFGEAPTWASHTGMVLEVDGRPVLLVEALTRTVVRPVEDYRRTKARLLVTRMPRGLTPEERARLQEVARGYVGRRYGYHVIALHALDRFFDNAYLFRRLLGSGMRYPICSWLVAWCYDKAVGGYEFGAPRNMVQPDDILDHCMSDRWPIVWVDDASSLASLETIYAEQGKESAGTSLEAPLRSVPVRFDREPAKVRAEARAKGRGGG